MADLAEMIHEKQAMIEALREQIAQLEAELAGALDALQKSKPTRRGRRPVRQRPIHETSNIGWAVKILKHNQRPMHVDSLLKRVEEMTGLSVRKTTLVSNLSRYVRARDTFTRPEPNTYGLIEWERKEVA